MDTAALIHLSQQLIEDGQRLVESENFAEAREKFKQSVALYPSAQGLTFWAWMESYEGNIAFAIDLCQKAIALNPHFGNAYNDIGCYYVLLEQFELAEAWLEKAKSAVDYDFPQFPYLNLGRLHIRLGNIQKAIQEFRGALTFDPHNAEARYMIQHLSAPDFLPLGYIKSSFQLTESEEDPYVSVFSLN